MCGIAGLAYRRAHDFPQEAERRVQTMIDVQAHRGPDVRQYHRLPNER
jgi:asparagine synthetase B (glutamine-hydrolysing)